MPGPGQRAGQSQLTQLGATADRVAWSLAIPLLAADAIAQQADVLERLRQVTGDRRLSLSAVEGSEVAEEPTHLNFESSRDGWHRLEALWKSKQLPMLLGIPVQNLQRLPRQQRVAVAQEHQHAHHLAARQKTTQVKRAAPPPPEPPPSDGRAEERTIYAHLQDCLFQEPPPRILERFHHLFIEAVNYEDMAILAALERIAFAPDAAEHFAQFLNHCCYLAIDYWQFDPDSCPYVFDLLALFRQVPDPGMRQSRRVRFVRQASQEFADTEQYRMLQRLARVLNPRRAAPDDREAPSLGDLIHRYPFLYRHCLLNEDSSYEDQQTVKQVQSRIQHHLEFALTRFVTYQVRLAQVAKARQLSSGAGRLLRREPNPTLLGNRELASALKYFFGRLPNSHWNHRELAQRFLYELDGIRTYAAFKTALCNYLLVSIADLPYCQQQFGDRLQSQIAATLPHYDQHRLDESLILRTATKLVNFLVVEPHSAQHYLFVDLTTHLGATMAMGMLLRLSLICRPVLPEIERRLALLFEHYEASPPSEVGWLVKVLENQNLAFSIHFGNADLSPLKQLVKA